MCLSPGELPVVTFIVFSNTNFDFQPFQWKQSKCRKEEKFVFIRQLKLLSWSIKLTKEFFNSEETPRGEVINEALIKRVLKHFDVILKIHCASKNR